VGLAAGRSSPPLHLVSLLCGCLVLLVPSFNGFGSLPADVYIIKHGAHTHNHAIQMQRGGAGKAVASQGDLLTLEGLRSNILDMQQTLCDEFQVASATAVGSDIKERVSLNLLATRLESLSLNRCHVAKSTIAEAGNGVFASEEISAGELVTIYPGDGVLIEGAEAGLWIVQKPDGSQRHPDASVLERAKDYEMEVEALGSVSLLGDPQLVHDAAYIGHIINDGCVCSRDAFRSAYVAEAALVCNVHQVSVHGSHMAVVATRDIWEGEELFMSYGARYWVSRLASSGTAYEGRMLEDYWIEEHGEEEYAQHRMSRSEAAARRGGGRRSRSRED